MQPSHVHAHEPPNRRGPVHRAVYGTSGRLGDVEFLNARFGSHRFSPHTHPVFAVGCVVRGACRVWHRGESHVAEPGGIIMINPGDPHSAEPAGNDPWDYSALYFPAETAARWLPGRAVRRGSLRLHGVVGREPVVARALRTLCQALENDPDSASSEANFAGLVAALFSRFGHSPTACTSVEGTERLERVRQFLEDNFAEPIRIRALADLAGRSPFHLIREFSHAFGMPPYTYLLHVRVAKARGMLKAGCPITETAMSVGFSDQSHLTRFFRRITGVPPGVYVKGVAGQRRAIHSRLDGTNELPVGRPEQLIRA